MKLPIVPIDYFSKWVEPELVATITVERFDCWTVDDKDRVDDGVGRLV